MDKKATIDMITTVSQVNDSKSYLLTAIESYRKKGAKFYNFCVDLDLKDNISPMELETKKNMLNDLKREKFSLFLAKKKFDVEYVPVSTLYN